MYFIIHGELQLHGQKVQNIENVEVEAMEKSLKNKITSLVETNLFSEMCSQLKKDRKDTTFANEIYMHMDYDDIITDVDEILGMCFEFKDKLHSISKVLILAMIFFIFE